MNKGDLQVAFIYIIMINKLRLLFSATYGNLFKRIHMNISNYYIKKVLVSFHEKVLYLDLYRSMDFFMNSYRKDNKQFQQINEKIKSITGNILTIHEMDDYCLIIKNDYYKQKKNTNKFKYFKDKNNNFKHMVNSYNFRKNLSHLFFKNLSAKELSFYIDDLNFLTIKEIRNNHIEKIVGSNNLELIENVLSLLYTNDEINKKDKLRLVEYFYSNFTNFNKIDLQKESIFLCNYIDILLEKVFTSDDGIKELDTLINKKFKDIINFTKNGQKEYSNPRVIDQKLNNLLELKSIIDIKMDNIKLRDVIIKAPRENILKRDKRL